LMRTPSETIRSFAGKKVLIAGDLVADQFLHGTIARVSREAPVFILEHDETHTMPGGAANAAVNIASMGGEPILVGVVGNDPNGRLLENAIHRAGVGCERVVRHDDVSTTTKVRVLAGQQYAGRQQVIRIDYGRQEELPDAITDRSCSALTEAAMSADAIVVSDYNYGVVSPKLFAAAIDASKDRGIPLVIDSRFRLPLFVGATSATPNQDEVEQILGKNFTFESCEMLRRKLGLESLLMTRGNQGMVLFESGREPFEMAAVGPTEPVDVTGAGDTVIAAYALGLAAGLSFGYAAEVANHAGGIVVMKKGTASATAQELFESLQQNASVSAEVGA
jgi:D-glycero-beta-D-manno-heptose-7-phosphate kinase